MHLSVDIPAQGLSRISGGDFRPYFYVSTNDRSEYPDGDYSCPKCIPVNASLDSYNSVVFEKYLNHGDPSFETSDVDYRIIENSSLIRIGAVLETKRSEAMFLWLIATAPYSEVQKSDIFNFA